jgi:Gram-negative bacterial TonB protein C-terminal
VAFARLMADELQLGGLWFDAPACAKQFSAERKVAADEWPALLACLAKLNLRLSPDVGDGTGRPALTYEPGVALAVAARGGGVRWIGSATRISDPTAAPVTAAELAAHITSGTRVVVPDQAVLDAIMQATQPLDKFASASLRVCVDARGNVDRVEVGHHSDHPSYVKATRDAVATWRFKPFHAHGKAVRVCSFAAFRYPAD